MLNLIRIGRRIYEFNMPKREKFCGANLVIGKLKTKSAKYVGKQHLRIYRLKYIGVIIVMRLLSDLAIAIWAHALNVVIR